MKTVMRICIVVTVIWGSTSTTRATIRNVPSVYPTIQAAIDISINGDEIVVADGVYNGVGNCNLNFYGKAVTLRSENGPEVCIIDCEGNCRGISFVSGEGPSTMLEGMTIKNARTTGGYPVSYGAGIKCVDSSPTITDCIFGNNNTDHSGGGIGIIGGSPTISKCAFTENSAIDGSGIVIHKYDSATVPQVDITECVFTNNYSSSNNGDGGGIFVGESEVLITNCIFEGNSARCGGAIYHQLGTLTIINCLITNNSASLCGGGLGFGWGSQKTICNCTISNNSVDDSYPGQTRGGGGVFFFISSLLFRTKLSKLCCVISFEEFGLANRS